MRPKRVGRTMLYLFWLAFESCACFSLLQLPSDYRAIPSVSAIRPPSPNASPQGKSLERRLQLFGGCSEPERAYLDGLLHGDIRRILHACAILTTRRDNVHVRRKFRQYFGDRFVRIFAESVKNWIMQTEFERGSTPGGQWAVFCRLDNSPCEEHMLGYVDHRRNMIVFVGGLNPRHFMRLKQIPNLPLSVPGLLGKLSQPPP